MTRTRRSRTRTPLGRGTDSEAANLNLCDLPVPVSRPGLTHAGRLPVTRRALGLAESESARRRPGLVTGLSVGPARRRRASGCWAGVRPGPAGGGTETRRKRRRLKSASCHSDGPVTVPEGPGSLTRSLRPAAAATGTVTPRRRAEPPQLRRPPRRLRPGHESRLEVYHDRRS